MPRIDPPPDWVLQRRRVIGDRIRAARRDRGMSQERLAELAGMDRQAVGKLELGYTSPLLDTLLRIADVLDVELSDLVRRKE
ncbi:helix-turn-helix transcriptional regulator [Streptomyces sp. CNQ085]|uniref:helix-turn-helix transcriptional regulator n=1 Tax=Streptomyces sp. CNQ085 TaxID=2886944 RepID=UPI001F50C9AF|nr:helix-turn-helix transcriptional regulator [Streptomyces sp. CNQ085]MCI0384602.1 helix-turn-helix domain-containing protein [Streptomyces sp. CNQ085]